MDQDRRPDHRPHLPLLLTHLWTGTLADVGRQVLIGRQELSPPRLGVAAVTPGDVGGEISCHPSEPDAGAGYRGPGRRRGSASSAASERCSPHSRASAACLRAASPRALRRSARSGCWLASQSIVAAILSSVLASASATSTTLAWRLCENSCTLWASRSSVFGLITRSSLAVMKPSSRSA